MALKLRPTGLGFGIDKDRQDFTIYSGGWAMGRVYEQRGRPDSMRWFWSLHGIFGKPADMRADDHAATLDGAKAQFEIDMAAPAGVGEAAGNAVSAPASGAGLEKACETGGDAPCRPRGCEPVGLIALSSR